MVTFAARWDTGFQWFTALQDSIESLAEFPERCPLAPESALFPFEVRQLLYGQTPHVYRILLPLPATQYTCCTSVTPAVSP
jgi:hypothetical protein